MKPYTIIPPYEIYPLSSQISLITGTPFLFLQKDKLMICGDLHLGHESSLFAVNNTLRVSASCINFLHQFQLSRDKFSIEKIILNGDLKHFSNTISNQEIVELQYLFDYFSEVGIKIEVIIGNHDKFLPFIMPYIDDHDINVNDYISYGSNFIAHGDKNFDPKGHSTIILSHEHPAINLRGYNRARAKLSAFVTLQAAKYKVIILPAANSISLGVEYPLKEKSQFLSPFLKRQADIRTQEIFPFDNEVGLLELPPISMWEL